MMQQDVQTGLYLVNGTFTASFMALRSRVSKSGLLTWLFQLARLHQPDLLLVGRMDRANQSVLDYFVMSMQSLRTPNVRVLAGRPSQLDPFRCDNFDPFFESAVKRLRSASELSLKSVSPPQVRV